MTDANNNNMSDIEKINTLKETIVAAEKTLRDAKMMLLNLEGPTQKTSSETSDTSAIYGEFDGQTMLGDDKKQYPVPANYASKSKLVEGDKLKLTIAPNGSFLYKQVGPANRKSLIGMAGKDENDNFYVVSEGRPYKILLASITYFKVEPGDEVVIITSRDKNSLWAAVENVLSKGKEKYLESPSSDMFLEEHTSSAPTENKIFAEDSWVSDIEEIKKEIQERGLQSE